MKKKNFFICFIFAFLMCFSLNFFAGTKKAFAEDSQTITITFDANGGTCDIKTLQLQVGESISELPVATYNGYIFMGWKNESGQVTTSTTFDQDSTLVASYVRKINKYTITNSSTYLKVTGETTSSETNYVLADNLELLDEALNLISNDLSSASNAATIIFDNITLVQDLSISFQNLTLSGTLNLEEYSIVYTAPNASSRLYLSDLSLNSTASQDLVNIDGENSSIITVSNTNFNSGSKQNNYSIKLINPIHTLSFQNSLSYSTEYLYNYELADGNPDFQRRATFESSFSLTSPTNIAITIPYNVDGQPILITWAGNSELFSVYPTQTNYTCSVQPKLNGGYLSVNTNFNINFDENGASVIEPYSANNLSFNTNAQIDFPTETNYSKEHYSLNGFVAKITLDPQTMSDNSISNAVWFFDKTALENYIQNGSVISTIPTYFFSEIPNTTLSCFNYYKHDNTSSDLNFLATNLMLSLNQTPEFVAIWSQIQYSITLEEKGGGEVYDITGTFGSSVTLPTPTKVGYDFSGWFIDEDLNIASEITTMPDTYPTLYAGWTIRTHTLTIYQNNQTSKIELPVDFGTLINSIDEANQDIISKTGYTFEGWYTDQGLTEPLDENATMPDENITIYAKWTINQYTITLYYNHKSVPENSIFKTTTQDYNSDISRIFSTTPSFDGYTFNFWCTDKNGRYPYDFNPVTEAYDFPETMPASDLTLYAYFTPIEYYLTIYYPAVNQNERKIRYYDDELNLLTPIYAGLIFDGWFTDENFTEELNLTSMPNRNLSVYAKLKEKATLSLSLDIQTYTISESKGFVLDSKLAGFVIEYLVKDEWTTNVPTAKGIYDVRISRNEDSFYKSFVQTIEDGLVITANAVDVSTYSFILYCLAGLELICAIIILFLRKQRKTYLTYAIALPFGVVSNSQFINLIISIILAVFGFVLIIIQIVKLKKINNEIAKISTENKEYTPPDVSENHSISRNVEILLQKEGFVSVKDYKETEIVEDEELDEAVDSASKDDSDDDDEYASKDDSDDDDDGYLTFSSKNSRED